MRRAALAVTLLVVAGCGGGEEERTVAPSATAASVPSEVAIKDFTFTPAEVDVAAGDDVTWSNADASNHNVVFDDKAQKGISNLREGEQGSVTFSKTGSFAYVCTYHPGMKGTVVVE